MRLLVKLLQKFKNPEMIRKPTPNFQHGYQKTEHGGEHRPQSAQGIPFTNMQSINALPRANDTPVRAQLRKAASEDMDTMRTEGILKTERIMTTAQSQKISIKGNQLRILNFCSNNYLGMSNNPEIVKFSKNIMVQYGAGMSSVRHISGTQDIHKDLEKQISKFHGREDAMLYNSCYDANAGIFNSLLTNQDAVFVDENSHVSIQDGIQLCDAKKYVYKHRNVSGKFSLELVSLGIEVHKPAKVRRNCLSVGEGFVTHKSQKHELEKEKLLNVKYIYGTISILLLDLENQLKSSTARLKLIATDGVFSADATIAPLKEIVELADKYQAVTFVDDCHGTGIIGKTGLGSEEYCDVKGRIDIINSSLGKALGGAAGGYTTGPSEVISLLRQKSKPYLFSNSLSPAMVASGTVALELLMRSEGLIKKLEENTERFRSKMKEAGFVILGDNHPMCPVVIGNNQETLTFADKIQWRGTFVMPLTYPLAPKDKPVIRVIISAAHTTDDIDRAVESFVYMGKLLKVIS